MPIPKLETIRNNLARCLPDQCTEFESIPSDAEKIKDCWHCLSCIGLFDKFNEVTYKSVALSEKFRLQGNQDFANNKDLAAIRHYTIAAGYAPKDSRELVLAIANRSAVTSSLGDHEDCINDINFALEHHYPEPLKFKLHLRRGISLIYLSQFKSASESLQLARETLSSSGLSGEKREKIEVKISECLAECSSYIDESDTTKTGSKDSLSGCGENIPPVSYGKNVMVDCASSAVEISYSKEMGRHLVAARDINPGDVLAVEKAYCAVVSAEVYGHYCSNCLKRCHSLVPCDRCPQAYFCSTSCRDESMLTSHGVECQLLGVLLALGCSKVELLAVRTLIVVANQGARLHQLLEEATAEPPWASDQPLLWGTYNGRYDSSSHLAVNCLETNVHLRDTQDILMRCITAACLIQALAATSNFFSHLPQDTELRDEMDPWMAFAGVLLLKYLQIMPSNAHQVSEMLVDLNRPNTESIEIGSGLYPFLSLANHSCNPNVSRDCYDGSTLVMIAIQVIPAGAQIFDNYGYHFAVENRVNRQTSLMSQYYFTCECEACLGDWPLYHSTPYRLSDQSLIKDEAAHEKLKLLYEKFQNELITLKYDHKVDSLQFFYSFLKLLHANVKKPSREYCECQEAIKECHGLKSNHYTYKSKCDIKV